MDGGGGWGLLLSRWVKVHTHTHKKKRGAGGRYGGGGGRREAGFGGFPTPARALGSRGGKYLPLWGGLGSRRRQRRLPLVGLEVVELVELEADVLDGELQQVPETGQVLGGGPGAGVHILSGRGTGRGRGRTEGQEEEEQRKGYGERRRTVHRVSGAATGETGKKILRHQINHIKKSHHHEINQ